MCYTLSGNTVVFTMGEDIQQALQVGPVLEVLVNLDDRHLPEFRRALAAIFPVARSPQGAEHPGR